jgi:hypothetical protein
MANPETLAKVAEVSGAAVAVGCGVCKWLADNHDFLASLGIIVGGGVALLGLAANVYFRRREDIRQQQAHNARLMVGRTHG